MKKLILLTSLFVLPLVFLQAKTVDFQTVVNVAAKVIGEKPTKSGISISATPESRLTLIKSASAESNYYVFNEADGNGFVIISGDDVAKPILGYSDNGNYDENNLAPAFVYWMECLQREIAFAIENDLPQSKEVKMEWDSYLDNNSSHNGWRADNVIVPPLVQTKWSQTSPYNGMCPQLTGGESSYGGRAPTGCVATAMAQLMRYYNYPAQGTGASPAYSTNTPSSINMLPVNFNVNYAWNNMSLTYSGSSTAAQDSAVATLMYHCGVSVKMDYQATASGAVTRNAAQSLVNYFDYDASISTKDRMYYGNAAWETMLKQQIIDKKRPVIYSGRNTATDSGHAFICDGYAEGGYFHFNWGWGGYQDGYYLTTALEPGTGGTGSGAGSYNDEQMIIVNIMPNEGGEPSTELWLYTNMTSTPATLSVNRDEQFKVSTSVINRGTNPSPAGNIGIALVNDDDEILELVYFANFATLAKNYYRNLDTLKCAVSGNIEPGNYKLRVVERTLGGEWEILSGSTSMIDKLDIEVKNGILPELSNLRLSNGTNPAFVPTPNPIQRGKPLYVQFGLFNGGTGIFSGEISLGLYDTGGNLVELIEKLHLSIPNDGYYHPYTFCSSQITAPCGAYKMRLCQKNSAGVEKTVANNGITHMNNMTVTVTGNSYMVTFDTKGGDSMAPEQISSCDALPTPSHTGYDFESWFRDADCSSAWTSSDILTRDITLYAKWKPVQYTITYVLDEGINNVLNPESYTIESPEIILQDPTKEGYEFVKWTEGNTIETGSTGNKTFTAEWSVGVMTAALETTNSVLSVYPNPAENIVQISGEKVLSVEIKDLTGRTIKQSNETEISVKDLYNGIYLFVIQTENGIVVKKIVKK